MSARSKIVNALVDKFKSINGTGTYKSNLYENIEPRLRFWDEVNDMPFVCVTAGDETREYLPSGFKWGYLNITIRIFVDSEDPVEELENIFEDIETVLDANNSLVYDTNKSTTMISIISITSDEGVMAPQGIGEMLVTVQYDI
jgi:hypothetical protein